MSIFPRQLLLCLTLITCMSSQLRAGDFIRPTAVLDRSGNKRIRLSISFEKLREADLQALKISPSDLDTARVALIRQLDLCIVTTAESDCGESVLKVKYSDATLDETPETSQSTTQFADIDSNTLRFELDPLDSTQKLKADIYISTTDVNNPFNVGTFIATKIVYGNPTVTEEEKGIKVTFAKGVSQAPEGLTVVGSKGSLSAYWTQLNTVTTQGTGTISPSGMLAILVPASLFQTADLFKSYIYAEDFSQQTATSSCSLVISTDQSTCSVQCNGDQAQLIDVNSLGQYSQEGLLFQQVRAGNSVSFNDVQPDTDYAIVLQYEPDGLQRSCAIGQSSNALILTEITAGKEPSPGETTCFVATAAYGSPLDAHLKSLRWFRDHALLPTSWGYKLVKEYYRYGPAAAAYISDKPMLRAIVRGLLWPIVKLIEAYRQQPGVFTGMFFMLLAAPMLMTRRRRAAKFQ